MPEAGQTLSHYTLVEKIGQGGMGEVWKATDSRLDREVALKLLPEQLIADASRLDRFAREAKLLASLNHPGIATIHDVDEHEGLRFLVMEYVPGEDLAQILGRGAMPLADSLEVALQIAKAVEAAHGQGVVHRDLKPANVKRAPGGAIKVLDFGLAKAMAPESTAGEPSTSLSPTVTSAGTIAGVILGTAAYMSPEQARGRPVDKRTDVWSFGVVLYELLTGDNPFRGDTVADSVGAIMHREIDLEALPVKTPTVVKRLLRRCLTRERAQRLHDIADARIELEEAIANPVVEGAGATAVAAAPASKLPWIALAVAVPVIAVLGWLLGSRAEPAAPEPTRRFALAEDLEVDLVELSPDGTRIAYKSGRDLFIRALDSLEPRRIDGIDATESGMFWSPDGLSLGIASRPGKLERIDLDGGAPVVLAEVDGFIAWPTWADDGHIYFTQFQDGVSRIPATGGAVEPVLDPHPDMLDHHGLTVLPESRGFLTLPHLQSGDYKTIFFERPGKEPRVLFESDSPLNGCWYSATGHILFGRDDNPRGLWAVEFSLEKIEVTGKPFLVVPDLGADAPGLVSATGDLVYSRKELQVGKRKWEVLWIDRQGEVVDRLDMALYEASEVVPSHDESKLAVIARGVNRPSMDESNLWVIDLERRTNVRLTEGGIGQGVPVWSADGSRVGYVREAEGTDGKKSFASLRADGTGDPEIVFEADVAFFVQLDRDWSRATFMTGALSNERGLGINVLETGDPSSERVFVDGPEQDIGAVIHPSGKWVAYASGDFTSLATIVRPFPEGEGQWTASVGDGGVPMWSPEGDTLYYLRRDGTDTVLVEVGFDGSGGQPAFGRPVDLFKVPSDRSVYAVSEDRFIFLVESEPEEGEKAPNTKGIILVQNWPSRVK
ncbi:MAG: protein kinase [Acidobacteria bacterium]|nr:protein kinase [Acidobacteriota bacterium]NIM60423.1 protein kinase [Acidobacteriota bacterium]NIO58598.1 protein kinase [Acidobacteriota bacterium]NIQ29650.1 protein kinase [Acidobacteriota bacterium]NIQ84367.1 protein kinase [Acidobacteriota bacterium]